MEFQLDSDMPITQMAAGLILVARLCWQAAFISMLLVIVYIARTIPGALPQPGRRHV
jgi:hypothetical protein